MKRIFTLLISLACLLGVGACNTSEDERAHSSDPAPEGEEETDADYIGLPRQVAETRAFRRNQAFRYVRIDGEPQAVTADYNPNRLNFTVERDIVVGVSRG